MNTELELALQDLEEIDDVESWEGAFLNTIAESTRQIEFNRDKSDPSYLMSLNDREIISHCPEIFQKICMKKLIEYKCKILEQQEFLLAKEEEVYALREEESHLRDSNNTLIQSINSLKLFLEKADAGNSALRSENIELKSQVKLLEDTIFQIEDQKADLISRMVEDQAEMQNLQINELKNVVAQQKEVIQQLRRDLEEMDLLKQHNLDLEKEAALVEPLRKEVKRLEGTLAQFQQDYQDLIGVLEEEANLAQENEGTSKEDEFSKHSTTTSRNVDESDDESQNKNVFSIRDSTSLTPKEKNSHEKERTNSLLKDIIVTKFSGSPLQKLKRNVSHMPHSSNLFKVFKSIDLPKNSKSKVTHSKSVQLNKIRQKSQVAQSGNLPVISRDEMETVGEFTKKTREIIASELGSDDEREEFNMVQGETFERNSGYHQRDDSRDLVNLFEDEKILLSWDEEDFKRLPSMTSVVDSEKSTHEETYDLTKKVIPPAESIQASVPYLSSNRPRAMSGLGSQLYVQPRKEFHRRTESNYHHFSSARKEENISPDQVKKKRTRTISLGFLLGQKLENLKSEKEELRCSLNRQELDVKKPFEKLADLSARLKMQNVYQGELPVSEEGDTPADSPINQVFNQCTKEIEAERITEQYYERSSEVVFREEEPEKSELKLTAVPIEQNNIEIGIQTESPLEESSCFLSQKKEFCASNLFSSSCETAVSSLIHKVSTVTKETQTQDGYFLTQYNEDFYQKNNAPTQKRGMISSIALTGLPLIAGASLTYLFLKRKIS